MPAIEIGRYLEGSAKRHHECIEACIECLVACEVCADASLGEQKIGELVRSIKLSRDCAEMCQTAARVMMRDGEQAEEVCRACAELCEECAAECEKHTQQHCKRCAEACRRCAEECRKMAA